MEKQDPRIALIVSIPAIASAAALIKLCGMDWAAVAAYRMLGGALVFLVLARFSIKPVLKLTAARKLLLVSAGAALAAHFGLWIAAFDHTDVASNLLLLVTQPAFAAVFGYFFYREGFTLNTLAALALAAGGSVIIMLADADLETCYLRGDVLCVTSSLSLAIFYTLAKTLRRDLGFAVFNFSVFALAAAFLFPLGILAGTAWTGYTAESWTYLGLIILVPTCTGHALMNYAARSARVFTVNMTIIGEPALGIPLAVLLLENETVSALKIAGGAVLLISVLIAFRDEGKKPAE